jgi:hypothetical protein
MEVIARFRLGKSSNELSESISHFNFILPKFKRQGGIGWFTKCEISLPEGKKQFIWRGIGAGMEIRSHVKPLRPPFTFACFASLREAYAGFFAPWREER